CTWAWSWCFLPSASAWSAPSNACNRSSRAAPCHAVAQLVSVVASGEAHHDALSGSNRNGWHLRDRSPRLAGALYLPVRRAVEAGVVRMTSNALLQLTVYVVVLIALVKPLGLFMARVYENKPCGLDKILGPLERFVYRLCGVDPKAEMSWQHYTYA